MAAATWSATATSSTIVAADAERDHYILQLISGDPVSIAFGETIAYAGGVTLLAAGESLRIDGWLARKAVTAICDSGNSASGVFQDGEVTANIAQ